MKIKNKNYIEVKDRIKEFRTNPKYDGWRLSTSICDHEDGFIIMKTTIMDVEGDVVSTGIAYEKEDSSFINKTSYIENCETSAVGRALGFLNIGIDGAICSAEEVGNAILNQTPHGKETNLTYFDKVNDKLDKVTSFEELEEVWKGSDKEIKYLKAQDTSLYLDLETKKNDLKDTLFGKES